MHTSTIGERVTAFVSALAAVAILGAAVTAQPSRTPASERLASLESDLRFQLELVGRQDQGVLKARTAELEQTLAAWRASPRSARDYELMVAWLRGSIKASLPGESGKWPARPEFGKEPAGRGSESGARSQESARAAAKPQVLTGDAQPQAAEARAPSDIAQPNRTAPPAVVREGHAREQPVVSTPPHVETPAPAPLSPPIEATAPVEIAVQPGPTPEEVEPSAAEERSVTVRKIPPETSETPAAAAPDPAPIGAASTKTASAGNESTEKSPAKPVQLNLAELNARIGGYHDGLKEIEAAIVAGREDLTPAKLAALVDQIEQLAHQYRFVRLYYDALQGDELLFVMEPRSMEATIDMLELERLRVESTGEDDFLSPAEDSVEGSALARRLKAAAELVSSKQ